MTAVSLACCLSSGGASPWPCVADLISASTRACGTGLPLTTATFCAITASGSTRVPISAAEDLKFMLGDFRANGFGRDQEQTSSWGVSPCRGGVQVGETRYLLDISKGTHRETLSRIRNTET